MILMNTWLFTTGLSKFHTSPRPWTTWHAPLIGQFFMKRHKVLSHHGPSATTARGIERNEAPRLSSRFRRTRFRSRRPHLAAHHPDAGRGSRMAGYANDRARLPELASKPVCCYGLRADEVFPIEYRPSNHRSCRTRKVRLPSIARGTSFKMTGDRTLAVRDRRFP